MAKKKAQPPRKDLSIAPNEAWKLSIPFLVLVVLRVVAGFFPEERLWGLNHFAFLPDWVAYVFAAMGVLFATPWLFGIYRWKAETFFSGAKGKPAYLVLMLAVFGAAFWFFRMKTYFLGDGAVYLAEHYRFVRDLPVSEDVLFSKLSAPLTATILAYSAKLFASFASDANSLLMNPQFSFWILGLVAGLVLVSLAWRFAFNSSHHAEERFAYFILLVFGAGTLFYFGYVEYYTFSYTALAAYFALLIPAVEGRVRLVIPAAVLLVAVAFHFMAVVAAPSFFVLLILRARSERLRALVTLRNLLIVFAGVLIAGGVYYFASGIYRDGSRVVLSLFPFGGEGTMHSYTLLSSWHLIDYANYLILLSGPVLIAMAFIPWREAQHRPVALVALVNFVFFVFLSFFGNMGFGIARDWDINAVLGLTVLFFFIALVRSMESSPRKFAVLYFAAGGMLVASLPWYAVNIIPESSVRRYKAVMALDDTHIAGDYALNGYEHLRKYFFSIDDHEGVAFCIRKKVEAVGYPNDLRKLALTAIQHLPAAQRKTHFDWVFDRLFVKLDAMNRSNAERLHAGTRREFVELVIENILQCHALPPADGFTPEYVESMFAKLEAVQPDDPVSHMARAQIAWDRQGGTADAAPFLAAVDVVQSSPLLCFYTGRALVNAKHYREARRVLERGYALDSSFTLPLVFLATALYQASPDNARRAIEYLERFIAEPAGHRLTQAPQEQQRLLAYAQGLLQHIRSQVR